MKNRSSSRSSVLISPEKTISRNAASKEGYIEDRQYQKDHFAEEKPQLGRHGVAVVVDGFSGSKKLRCIIGSSLVSSRLIVPEGRDFEESELDLCRSARSIGTGGVKAL